MKYRFLVQSLNHASGRVYVVVDISNLCLITEIYPEEGYRQNVPTICFQNWEGAMGYLLKWGADLVSLGQVHRTGVSMIETYIALKN